MRNPLILIRFPWFAFSVILALFWHFVVGRKVRLLGFGALLFTEFFAIVTFGQSTISTVGSILLALSGVYFAYLEMTDNQEVDYGIDDVVVFSMLISINDKTIINLFGGFLSVFLWLLTPVLGSLYLITFTLNPSSNALFSAIICILSSISLDLLFSQVSGGRGLKEKLSDRLRRVFPESRRILTQGI